MNHSGTLYVVATPIGNLQDITLRALETLKTVDVVAAEDTRHTAQLLGHFGIQTKLTALHEHNERNAGQKLVELLLAGKSIALVSDAGTPAISDPGAILVDLARQAGIRVVPTPGANAAIAALSASGIAAPHFLFYGFLPAKAAQRRHALEKLRQLPHTLVFYEAPHRVLESVADLATVLGDRKLTLARELTKTFESIHTCPLTQAPAWLEADTNRQRGEFVLLVEGAPAIEEQAADPETQRILSTLLHDLPLKQAVKLAAEISGAKKNALYELALTLKPEQP
ncbi:MAG TPA: 16S rRNA (cytidine(1402)-2'-O)-methyltransferase [Novimethylophilus sp.]|uniref:16S rRNA (cytidine(1402)-2'-O)-methyltransferase n=1 Tax=Novimethylophilus sp. TaxID=2137426 RepID=UPI002F41168A